MRTNVRPGVFGDRGFPAGAGRLATLDLGPWMRESGPLTFQPTGGSAVDDCVPHASAPVHRREVDVTKERIQKIIAAGANVILTTKGIDDVCMKYMVEAGVIGVRRCKKVGTRGCRRDSGWGGWGGGDETRGPDCLNV